LAWLFTTTVACVDEFPCVEQVTVALPLEQLMAPPDAVTDGGVCGKFGVPGACANAAADGSVLAAASSAATSAHDTRG
jgi:hypothetical protein